MVCYGYITIITILIMVKMVIDSRMMTNGTMQNSFAKLDIFLFNAHLVAYEQLLVMVKTIFDKNQVSTKKSIFYVKT